MAFETITFRGTTVWDEASDGAGYEFKPGNLVEEAVEVKAPLGDGYWVKPGGRATATHKLSAQWRTQTPATLRAAIVALATSTFGDLVIPVWGTYPNCRLSGVGDWEASGSDAETGYIVRGELTFTQYP